MYTHHGPMLYLTKDDQVVEEGDPRAAFVLVADGGQLSDEIAEKYGLTESEKKAKAEPPANKAKSEPPPNKKA